MFHTPHNNFSLVGNDIEHSQIHACADWPLDNGVYYIIALKPKRKYEMQSDNFGFMTIINFSKAFIIFCYHCKKLYIEYTSL